MIIRRLLSVVSTIAIFGFVCANASAQTSNLTFRAMAANITSGNFSSYETEGINIFKGLKPDIVAIQEFKYNNSTNESQIRTLVDTAFSTNFYFFKEVQAGFSKPNGIISRWPIIASGSWDDSVVPDRGFAWARIDLPGTNDLYVVSLHLYSSGSATDRNDEALAVKSNILANFPANAWVIVGGDFNTGSRSEAAVTTFKTFLSDSPIPTDAVGGGDPDTNEPRNNPYDYLLPSFSLTNAYVPPVLPSHTFPNGLVFDSAVYTPLSDVSPVASGDSHVSGMQHMAIVKDFTITVTVTNGPVTNAPNIVTQPQSQTNTVGTPVNFFVAASGTAPLAYQWRLNGTNLSGASATNYSIASVQTTNAGDYTVIVTNITGKATSDVATLTVLLSNTPPTITTNPIANQTNVIGTTANFSVVATGTAPLSYQWRFNGTNLSNATNSAYSKPNVQTNDAGPYTVVVTNIAGAVTSTPSLLVVTAPSSNAFTGVMAGWDVSGQSSYGTSPLAPSTNVANITVSNLTRGAGITTLNTAAARTWGGNGVDAASAAAAITANDFATFGVTANAGFTVSFTSISTLDYKKSNTGAPSGVLQYQVGSGGYTDVTNLTFPSTTGASLGPINLSAISALQNVPPGTNVTFRLVLFGATSSGGNWYLFDFAVSSAPDLAITGTVAPVAPPSGPPAIAPTLATPQLSSNQFIFQLTGTATSNYVVQVSTNLATTNWLSLQTNAAPFWFTNPIGQPQQFYRGLVAP